MAPVRVSARLPSGIHAVEGFVVFTPFATFSSDRSSLLVVVATLSSGGSHVPNFLFGAKNALDITRSSSMGRCGSLHWVLGKSQTYYPEHILVYGRREGLLLSCRGFRLFSDRLIGGRDGRVLSTALSPGLRSGGLESKFR